MPLDNVQRARSPSPAPSSGRDSPVPWRQSRRQLEEDEPKKQDKTYRRYASQIERALAHFDVGHLEWPDYISCLGRLLKSIQSHPPKVDSLPYSNTVASRLAQCLSPSLPSGVHSKALEVYAFIFTLNGKSGSARDLPIFLPGLSFVLTFASLSIRPIYLSLLEEHILPLGEAALRPALKALILSLLPGLEDETSEDFDRALKLVDGLKVAVNSATTDSKGVSTGFGDEFFWQSLFLAAIGGRSSRQGAYAYLVRRLPKLGAQKSGHADDDSLLLSNAAESVIAPEPGLLIRCFAAGLEDDQPLLQRGFLDLLLTHLPLDSPVLVNRVGPEDRQRLVAAATKVVARRDMSLNRRLWSWFLGPELSEAESEDNLPMSPLSPTTPSAMSTQNPNSRSMTYFKTYGSDALVKSVLSHFTLKKVAASERARPFRVCLSLMDRWEVGTLLVPSVFGVSMDNLMTYQSDATESEFHEVLRSASSFFDAIESGIIWAEIIRLVKSSLSSEPLAKESRIRALDLASFIVKNFNTREEDMIAFHIPLCCLLILAETIKRIDSPTSGPLSCDASTIARALQLAEQLISIMPERAHLNNSFGEALPTDVDRSAFGRENMLIRKIDAFYGDQNGDLSSSVPPFNSQDTALMTLFYSGQIVYSGLRHQVDPTQQEVRSHILSNLAEKIPSFDSLDLDTMVSEFTAALTTADSKQRLPFTSLLSIGQVLVRVVPKLQGSGDRQVKTLDLTSLLISELWEYLTPSSPKYHVEAVRALWQLDGLSPEDSILESSVSRFLAEGAARRPVDSIDVEPARRFSVLWSHSLPYFGASKRVNMWSRREGMMSAYITSLNHDEGEIALHRPLLLFLDALEEEETENHYFLVNWLSSMGNLYTIFDVLLSRLSLLQSQRDTATAPLANNQDASRKIQNEDTTRECLYYLQHLSNLLKLSGDQIHAVLRETLSMPGADDEDEDDSESVESVISGICLKLLKSELVESSSAGRMASSSLICTSLRILRQLLRNPEPKQLKDAAVEEQLVTFIECVASQRSWAASVQVALLDTALAYLQLKYVKTISRPKSHRKNSSLEPFNPPTTARLQNGDSKDAQRPASVQSSPPPKRLIQCLQDGIKSPSSHYVLENWISFLIDVLPLYYESLFQILMPLVETFCKQISTNFEQIQMVFHTGEVPAQVMTDSSLMSLMNGLEHVLALAHDRLSTEESASLAARQPERAQGFFGNVVSGVFASEGSKGQGSAANSRLTVILCLQDAVRSCFAVWTWGVQGPREDKRDATCSASYGYVASKLRNRARRLLDRMFVVEPLECLETLIAHRNEHLRKSSDTKMSVNHLLHALDGSRPKRIMPSIFNSLYSRTNPSALEQNQISSLSSDVKDVDIAAFLVEYTKSLEDDAMDEIWQDCMTFLKDVLSNPLIHSSILPPLLLFIVSLAEKIENTNFGEQRKMRKEISDIFLRLMAATFTSRPTQVLQELSDGDVNEKRLFRDRKDSIGTFSAARQTAITEILTMVVPRLNVVLVESDKLSTTVSNISTNVFQPVIHSKTFPEQVRLGVLKLLQKVMKITQASKVWRKDVSELFGHSKLFSCRRQVVEEGLLPVFRQWANSDKDRLPEAFARIAAPTSAGIMFGVGASAARLEADKKTQLSLRRIALLILSLDNDSVVPSLQSLEEKFIELLGATPSSSPSSMTRAEVFMVMQAVVLKTAAVHLAGLWTLITSELEKAVGSALATSKDYDTYNTPSLLQACKLLDMLVLMGPDGFQTHEWIFISDTIDAVYRPPQWEPTGLIDEIAEELGPGESVQSPSQHAMSEALAARSTAGRRPLLRVDGQAASMGKDEFVKKTLRPFFMQLSIHNFEGTYSMREPDLAWCRKTLLDDLFDNTTIMG